MKGRAPTVGQSRFHDLLCSRLGCVACRLDGRTNTYCSVHHIDGRTKPHAHWLVLPLCGGHHQDDGRGLIAIHPWKTRFEKKYGRQIDLLRRCIRWLLAHGFDVPQAAQTACGYLTATGGATA